MKLLKMFILPPVAGFCEVLHISMDIKVGFT